MYKRLYFIGIPAYIIMLILSILFYKERIIFLDAAFSSFNMIKDGTFCIQHYRFGDAFFQLLPLIAIKTHQNLNIILASYSAGYIVYYFITYLICGSILKRYDFALVILLMNILFVSHTFYWMLSQLPQAMALLMIIMALITDNRFNKSSLLIWAIIFIVEVIIIYFHPLIVFALVFSIIFFKSGKRSLIDNKTLYTIAGIYFIGILLKFFLFKSAYEEHSASGLKNFITQFPDYFTLYSNRQFLFNCVIKYYWIPVLFISIVIFYIKTRVTKKLLFFVIFFLGYLMLVNISYPKAITPEFYIENLYLPLGLFLALPFVFDLLPAIEKYDIGVPVIILIILTSCVRIYSTHIVYSNRLVLERKYLDEYGNRKVIIGAKKTDIDQLFMLWGTPYEFLLLSECERNKPASIIIDEDPAHRPWIVDQKKFLVVNWNIYPYHQLNPQYFHFTDTTSGYTIIR